MPRRKGEWRAGVRVAEAAPPAPVAPPAAAPQAAAAVSSQAHKPLWHRDPMQMAGAELRAHALAIGITKRDAETLTEDRLRANCRLHTVEYLTALAEEA